MWSIPIFSAICLWPISFYSIEAVPRYTTKPLKVGVEAFGIYLQDHYNNTDLFEKIKNDVYRHRLMLFRNQGQIPPDAFMTMFRGFGDAFRKPFTTQGNGSANHNKSPDPAIMRISNDVNEGYQNLGTSGWHIDGAYKSMPFSFLVFNAIKASRLGNTNFAGHREIMASMKRSMRQKLDHLWTAITRRVWGDTVYEIHPMIHTHPVVNESVFCLHLGYMRGVIADYGSPHQSHFNYGEMMQLKGQITHEITKDNRRMIYSHKWMDGDLVIIDNWQIAHMASKETQWPKEKIGLRVLHRLAINGTQRPTKDRFTEL